MQNHEANIRLTGPTDEPEMKRVLEYFSKYWGSSYAIPLDDEFRRTYGEITRARQKLEEDFDAESSSRRARRLLRSRLSKLVTRPEASPQQWILVTSDDNYEICSTKELWGDIDGGRISGLKEGDAVVFYIKGRKRAAGVALVGGQPFPISPNPWPDGIYRFAIRIEFILRPDVTLSFEPFIPNLSFITNKAKWGTHLQGFMHPIPYKDFDLLRNALAQATEKEALSA